MNFTAPILPGGRRARKLELDLLNAPQASQNLEITMSSGKISLKNDGKVWLVTGVAGFIGSNLLESLLQSGQRVTGLDNFATGRQKNLDQVREAVSREQWRRFKFLEGDIRRLEDCRQALKGVQVVLHQAALGSVPRSVDDPLASNASNVTGFLNMLVAARDAGREPVCLCLQQFGLWR